MPTTTMDAIAADSAVEAAAETVLAAAVANSTQASPLSSSAGVAVSPPLSLAHISASAAAPSEHSDSNGGDQASSQNDREDGADSGIHPTKRQRREEPFDASDSAPQ